MVAAIPDVIEAHKGRGIHGNGRVWRIEGLSSRVGRCKTKLLDVICTSARPFVHYEEGPEDIPELNAVVSIEPHVWRLPVGAPGRGLLKWLYLGNWQLYVRDEPLAVLPDLCRSTSAEVEAFIARSGVTVVIDSFHDDMSWVVGVRR
jgi:hypothetical protein